MFFPNGARLPRSYREATAQTIDREAQGIVADMVERPQQLLESDYSASTGWRRGSLQEITQHTIHFTEELNARSTNGLSPWTYRRTT